jgi:hypothetical protein
VTKCHTTRRRKRRLVCRLDVADRSRKCIRRRYKAGVEDPMPFTVHGRLSRIETIMERVPGPDDLSSLLMSLPYKDLAR